MGTIARSGVYPMTRHFRRCEVMEKSANRFCRLAAVATTVMLLGTGPSLAQTVPCSAFARTAYGGWKVLDPVMLNFNGRLFAPTVGTIFPAGSSQNGIEMSDVLDQRCRNR
jgi:hypothetical protein